MYYKNEQLHCILCQYSYEYIFVRFHFGVQLSRPWMRLHTASASALVGGLSSLEEKEWRSLHTQLLQESSLETASFRGQLTY